MRIKELDFHADCHCNLSFSQSDGLYLLSRTAKAKAAREEIKFSRAIGNWCKVHWRSLRGDLWQAWVCHLNLILPCGFFSRLCPADQKQGTHLNTRWQSPQRPLTKVYPGKRGDISGSHLPLCDARRHRPGHRVHPQSTRWRDRYTYIWGEHRQKVM